MNKRAYKQNCSLALASDLLGERWTFLILRELLIQPCRFKMLNEYLQGMGTNLLTTRLKELETNEIITRQENGGRQAPYVLTEKGKHCEPMILEIIRWGMTNTQFDESFLHFEHWDFLALKALFVPQQIAKNLKIKFKLKNGFAWVSVNSQQCKFGLEDTEEFDVIFVGNLKELQTQLQNDIKLKPELVEFVQCFSLPEK